MPKLCSRRSPRADCRTITNSSTLSTAPRIVSFESSEDGDVESMSVSPLPKIELTPRRPRSSSDASYTHRRRRAKTSLLRRPTPSVCLTSLVMTPAPSPAEATEDSYSPLSPASSCDDCSFSWGQFVDVIPPCSADTASISPGSERSLSPSFGSSFQPYPVERPTRRPFKFGKKRKGFLPDFVLRTPTSEVPQGCESEKPGREPCAEVESSTSTVDVVSAMKKMKV